MRRMLQPLSHVPVYHTDNNGTVMASMNNFWDYSQYYLKY